MHISLTNEQLRAGSVKTALTMGATYFLLGNEQVEHNLGRNIGCEAAIIIGLAIAALYVMNPKRESNSWFPMSRIKDLAASVYEIFPISVAAACTFLGLTTVLGNRTPLSNSTTRSAEEWVFSATTTHQLTSRIFQACIIAPVAEEILYRRALQEAVFNLQGAFRGKLGDSKELGSKKMRMTIQAMIFSLAHMQPGQSLPNQLLITSLAAYIGANLGKEKERRDGSLWFGAGYHCSLNMGAALTKIGSFLKFLLGKG